MALFGTEALRARRLFMFAAAALLAMCAFAAVAAPILLITSFWRCYLLALEVNRQHTSWLAQVVSSHGGLAIDITHWFDLDLSPRERNVNLSCTREDLSVYPDYSSPGPPAFNWYFAGFELRFDDEYIGSRSVSMVIPEACLFASVIPLSWAGRRFVIRRSRMKRQCCLNCGYDLRATPNACPECGAIPRGIPQATA